jgi:hypothetical protein
MSCVRALLVATLLIPASLMSAAAQPAPPSSRDTLRITAGVGVASHWDDETFLGRGVTLSFGVAQPSGAHVLLEGEGTWMTHHRDSGYLVAEGNPFSVMGRVAYLSGSPSTRARIVMSGGLGVIHSTGHFTMRSFVSGPGGVPVEAPPARSDWSLTRPLMDLGIGLEFGGASRWLVRSELRWTSSLGSDRPAGLVLEPPLWILRGGVVVGWRTTRCSH